MSWDLDEALSYYKNQGAPSDQAALISLLKEIQAESGGSISRTVISRLSAFYGIKDSLIFAIIKRIPSLKLSDTHCLELCGGPACSKRAELTAFIEKTYGRNNPKFQLRFTQCMHMCSQGPNIKWDGVLYNEANPALLKKLIAENT